MPMPCFVLFDTPGTFSIAVVPNEVRAIEGDPGADRARIYFSGVSEGVIVMGSLEDVSAKIQQALLQHEKSAVAL